MAEAGIRNMSAYIRKMALGGYVLHVDLEPVKELVSLQRCCANNLNQAAIHANSYGGLGWLIPLYRTIPTAKSIMPCAKS